MKAPVHVAVVGGSGSGKTWLAEKISAALAPRASRISLDDFYCDLSPLPESERAAVNFDDPAAIDWKKLQEVIEAMRVGEKIELPHYDFTTHTRRLETRSFTPPPMVIWDGLWLFHPGWLREKFDYGIFVDCDAAERFRRRSERDVRERGRLFESVQCQFFGHVQPMHDRFVEPQRRLMHETLRSPTNESEINALVYELLTKVCAN